MLTGLRCTSCGGTLAVSEGVTNLACQYCDTPLAVVGERGVTRLMVLDRVDRARAESVVRAWFGRGIRKEPALVREAGIEEAFLAWFPFVRVRGDVIGCVLGRRTRRVKRGNRWVTEEEPLERTVERSVDLVRSSADMAEFGVDRVDLSGDELLPLDEERLRARGMLFRLGRTPGEVADELSGRAMAEAASGVGVDRVTFSWLAAVRREVTVAHYPLWVLRYRFRGRTYQALVDAEDGTLAYGKAPGNHLYRASALVTACAGACFLLTTALQNLGLFLQSDESLGGAAVLALVAAGLVYWGYTQFRHGGVVEEGSGLAGDRGRQSLGTTVKSMMDKLK